VSKMCGGWAAWHLERVNDAFTTDTCHNKMEEVHRLGWQTMVVTQMMRHAAFTARWDAVGRRPVRRWWCNERGV